MLGGGGLEKQADILVREVVMPLVDKGNAPKYGITPTKGVLLSGPPGAGKTWIVKNLMSLLPDAMFHTVDGPELDSKF